MDSMSDGAMALMYPLYGAPSTTYKGVLEAFMEPIPRIRMDALAPG